MKKKFFVVLLILLFLPLAACSPIFPFLEQVDPAMWSISAELPPITDDAFHLLHLRDNEEVYIHLGMTREDARVAFPNLRDEGPVILPQWGTISFDEDDRIEQIIILVNAVAGNPYALLWTTPSGIALGSYWSEVHERFDAKYNVSSVDGTFAVYFTRDHIPVYPESEKWAYRSYYMDFTGDNPEARIFSIAMRSRSE